ncbi:hypothetical protein C3L33_13849, partial [Rhododendron williamsianum]
MHPPSAPPALRVRSPPRSPENWRRHRQKIGDDIARRVRHSCLDRYALVTRWRTRNGLECRCLGDAAISIAVLHHLSTESRRKKAIDELIRVVKNGGLVLITVWAVEQEDRSLVNEWTPLTDKYVEEWIGPNDPCMGNPPSLTLESIPEAEENIMGGKNYHGYFFDYEGSQTMHAIS